MVNTTAQLHPTKPELRFCAGSNPARGVPEIRDGEDLGQWSRLEIRLNAFRRSTITQKQFIIIIIENEFINSAFHQLDGRSACISILQNTCASSEFISGKNQATAQIRQSETFCKELAD